MDVNVSNGAVVLPSGHGADFQGFSVDESQAVEDVTPYGANAYSKNLGSGTPTQVISASGFATHSAAGANPGLGTLAAGGASATFTVDTGVTIAGSYIVQRIQLGHSRIRAGAPISFQLVNAGDPTVTWPVSA